jgi:hypothetical protein
MFCFWNNEEQRGARIVIACVFIKFLIAFQESLTPFQDLYADESLVYFEESLEQSIISYVIMKLNVWASQVYTGKNVNNPNT